MRKVFFIAAALAVLSAFQLHGMEERKREGTEWDNLRWYNANQNKLPRILMVGDSICNGYQGFVCKELAGAAYVSYWASSKCVTDPSYPSLLSFVLEQYDYKVIHFNNGLHSLGTDRPSWEEGLRRALDLIKQKAPNAKVILSTSTPLKDPARTEKAIELNKIMLKVNKDYNFPVNDLFALMNPLDRDKFWSDTYHYHGPAKQMQAKQVADYIRKALGAGRASAEEAKKALKDAETETGPDGKLKTTSGTNTVNNGDFEKNGGWSIYPRKPENCSFTFSEEDKHSGKKAAKIVILKAGAQFYQAAFAAKGPAKVTFSFWAKAEKEGKVQVFIRTARPPYKHYGKKTFTLATEWKKYSTEIELPDGYEAKGHNLFFVFPTEGTFWLDEVSNAE